MPTTYGDDDVGGLRRPAVPIDEDQLVLGAEGEGPAGPERRQAGVWRRVDGDLFWHHRDHP
jgi:hypothetical protein